MAYYIDIWWVSWHLKSCTAELFVQQLIQANNEETCKLSLTGPLLGTCTGKKTSNHCTTGPFWNESTDHWRIPLAKGQYKGFSCHDLIMEWDLVWGQVCVVAHVTSVIALYPPCLLHSAAPVARGNAEDVGKTSRGIFLPWHHQAVCCINIPIQATWRPLRVQRGGS